MIRKLKQEDAEDVAKLWLKANTDAHSFIPESYWRGNYENVKDMISDGEVYVNINKENGDINGFIGISGNHIEGLFVKASERCKGVGKSLLDHIKHKKSKLTLAVYEKNMRALDFYEREGFNVKRSAVDDNTGEKEWLMSWQKG